MDNLRITLLSHQKIIEKKKYAGGKIESRSEYYTLLMRKKEQ